jgi:hypothetical protein
MERRRFLQEPGLGQALSPGAYAAGYRALLAIPHDLYEAPLDHLQGVDLGTGACAAAPIGKSYRNYIISANGFVRLEL